MSNRRERLHDLNTVLTDFRMVYHLLKSGYRFDDEDAPAAFTQLEKALQLLQKEIQTLQAEK